MILVLDKDNYLEKIIMNKHQLNLQNYLGVGLKIQGRCVIN